MNAQFRPRWRDFRAASPLVPATEGTEVAAAAASGTFGSAARAKQKETSFQTTALIAAAREAGLILSVEGVDGLRLRHHDNPSPTPTLLQRLTENKVAVIAELQRETAVLEYALQRDIIATKSPPSKTKKPLPTGDLVLNRHGVLCGTCKKVAPGYGDAEHGYVCPGCAEWRAVGCAAFTAPATCDEATESRYGACLACGASIELHGNPKPASWRRVTDLDDVGLVTVRYVISSAIAIAREANR